MPASRALSPIGDMAASPVCYPSFAVIDSGFRYEEIARECMMITRRARRSILLACVFATACGGGGGGAGAPAPPGEPPPDDGDPPPVSGLDERPANSSCLAGEAPETVAAVETVPAFPDLPSFAQPIALRQAPGDSGRWYLAEKGGRILRFANAPSVSSLDVVVDISGRVNSGPNEAGLLGFAFHPDFAANGEVYLSYTAGNLVSRISRFTSADGGLTVEAGSEEILLTLDQPFGNHNGGNILFGPDGYLYAGFGDGGSAGDPNDLAQDTTTLHGAMLRIDVDGDRPYAVPSDNPFAPNALCSEGTGAGACPEIFAWGFRNPWRWSFDAATGELWLGDVGQNAWEEVDRVERGGNYGWRCREGAHDFDRSGLCPDDLVDPVIEYDHGIGRSITGGYVYRGDDIPELSGRYIFADLNGRLFASTDDGAGVLGFETLMTTGSSIVSFAEDEEGELLFLDYGANAIRRIVSAGGRSGGVVADRLSDTGCMDPDDPSKPGPALIPYEPIAGFWSDGAAKERWYSLPDGETVDVGGDGDWRFPAGSVLVKHFRLGGALIETRLFVRHTGGDWAGYTYEWNAAGTDAARVTGGRTKTVAGRTWVYPSGAQCLECHTQVAGYTLGLEHAQLNSNLRYPATGTTANQLVTADAIDVLTDPLSDDPADLPRLTDPADTTAPLEARARSWLHTNCANCHRPSGPTPSGMDLRYRVPLQDTGTCDALPLSGDLGIVDARIIAPGEPARSVLVLRTDRRDVHGMPPLATNLVDAEGVGLLSAWVESLGNCR